MPPAIRTKLPAKNHPGVSVIFISNRTAVVAVDYATGCSEDKRILAGVFSISGRIRAQGGIPGKVIEIAPVAL
jgi:hypothetical protein